MGASRPASHYANKTASTDVKKNKQQGFNNLEAVIVAAGARRNEQRLMRARTLEMRKKAKLGQ